MAGASLDQARDVSHNTALQVAGASHEAASQARGDSHGSALQVAGASRAASQARGRISIRLFKWRAPLSRQLLKHDFGGEGLNLRIFASMKLCSKGNG